MHSIVSEYKAIGLDQINGKELLNRFDTKFLIHREQLDGLLLQAKDNYDILEVNGERSRFYLSRYYDTHDYLMYHHHHNGKRNRYKIRLRTYEDTADVFVEIKFKANNGKLCKYRRLIDGDSLAEIEIQEFINDYSPYDPKLLGEKLNVRYQRITLVHKNTKERVTLDYNLSFITNDKLKKLGSVIIIEVKQARPFADSDFINLLRNENYRSVDFSKYCIGTALLNEDIKKNNFKDRIAELTNYKD
ncbi:MAG: polyphosphate polymerase domain-containing protein [Bacteroidales bacterium]|nr:polyphosphate polymerase domain-containing protein [Bacteroidales bacterium]